MRRQKIVRETAQALFAALYARATPPEVRTGLAWYPEARLEVKRMSETYGPTRRCVAGVIAALSQRMQWDLNLYKAEVLLASGHVAGLPGAIARARAILGGSAPAHVLRGPKTNAFYRALAGDDTAVVLDVHMLRAVDRVGVTPLQYGVLADALQRAAKSAGVSPAPFQAVCWVVQRGEG